MQPPQMDRRRIVALVSETLDNKTLLDGFPTGVRAYIEPLAEYGQLGIDFIVRTELDFHDRTTDLLRRRLQCRGDIGFRSLPTRPDIAVAQALSVSRFCV